MDNSRQKKISCGSYIIWASMTLAFGILLRHRPLSPGTYVVGLVPGAVVANLIHELFHLGAYIFLGIPWKRLRFAVFLMEKKENGVRLSIDRSQWIGQAECTCLYNRSISYLKYAAALLSGGGGCILLGGVMILLAGNVSPWVQGSLQCLATALLCNGLWHLLWPWSEDRKLLRAISEDRKGETL